MSITNATSDIGGSPPRPDAQPLRMRKYLFSVDRPVHLLVGTCAVICLLLVLGIFITLVWGSRPSFEKFGWGFLISTEWNPVAGRFGALSSIFGTLVSTAIAMILAVPLALTIALFLVELAPPWLSSIVGTAIELLAAIPSIIFGMWGLFVLAPFMAEYVQPVLQRQTFGLPLFSGPPMGIGMLTAGIVLALMVLPFITAITRDVFALTPSVVRESAYGMGATTWEVTRNVTIPHGLRGILGGAFMGLGRALGETMAVTFVIGNNHNISTSLYAAGGTISSTLANEFNEADTLLYRSSLIELGLVLLVITLAARMAAQLWLNRVSVKGRGRQ